MAFNKFSRLLILILIFMLSSFWLLSSIMTGYIRKKLPRLRLHSTQYVKGNICDQKQKETDRAWTDRFRANSFNINLSLEPYQNATRMHLGTKRPNLNLRNKRVWENLFIQMQENIGKKYAHQVPKTNLPSSFEITSNS